MAGFHDARVLAGEFDRPADDLRRLLAFYGLRSGAPQYLAAFARKLEESKPFRTDLTALLRSTRDLEHGRLRSDEMLELVAVAVGGEALPAAPDASPAAAYSLALVQMLLAGIGGWSDTGDRAAADGVRGGGASGGRETAEASGAWFAAPAEETAVDVRAFVRSDGPVRSDGHAGARIEERAEIPAARPEAMPEAGHGAGHVLRREPLSEIVRPSGSVRPPEMRERRKPGISPRGAVSVQETVNAGLGGASASRVEAGPQPWAGPESRRQTEPQLRAEPEAVRETAAATPTEWHSDQPDLAHGTRHRPVSRRLALEGVLAFAAVGLLVFGVVEGLRSRHAAPLPTGAVASSGPAARSPVVPPHEAPEAEPELPVAPSATAARSPGEAISVPSRVPAPAHALDARPDAPVPAVPEDEPLPAATASRPQRSAGATLTPTADLDAVAGRVFHGPVAVPEATMDRQLVSSRKAVYPQAALAQHVGGTVVLRAFVATDGTLRRTDVVAGPEALVPSALAAASWRRYRPFVLRGRPVEVETEITFHYAAQ